MKAYVQTNRMITEIDNKYGSDSKQALLMRLYVLSYKTNHTRTYEDCLRLFKKMKKEG